MGISSYELEVREFIPMERDLMGKFWTTDGVRKAVKMTPYAIIDLEKAAVARIRYVNDNVGAYVDGTIDKEDVLMRNTVEEALRHAKEAQVSLIDTRKCQELMVYREKRREHCSEMFSIYG